MWRRVIASIIYCSGHIGSVIASYGYYSKLIDQRYYLYSLSLLHYFFICFHLLQFLRFRFFSQNMLLIQVTDTLKKRCSIFKYFRRTSKLVGNKRYNVIAITLSYNLRYLIILAQWEYIIASKNYRF